MHKNGEDNSDLLILERHSLPMFFFKLNTETQERKQTCDI